MLLWWALACDPAPVVSAVPDAGAGRAGEAKSNGVAPGERPTEAQVTERRQRQELRASPENLIATYRKPEGVYIDARYFGGRNYELVRAQLVEQLGALQDSADLGWQGQEMTFERGSVRVKDKEIYMIEVPLPEELRRTDALAVLGFPPASRDYTDLTHEYRLNNAWGFRRIRFLRVAPGSEMIRTVELWKEEPRG